MIIVDGDDLKITFEQGTSDTAIVSFTGIGTGLGGIQKQEFVKTLNSSEVTHSAFYVIDKARSWYNRTRDPILRHLEAPLRDFERVVTLGNSMGGFGALYFSGLLPRCRRAIAFVPQFSLAPTMVPDRDKRWMVWRSKIESWRVVHALENISDSAPSVAFFGANDQLDRWHADQFRGRLIEPHFVIKVGGCGHNVAVALKAKGKLNQIIARAIEGAPGPRLAAMLRPAGLNIQAKLKDRETEPSGRSAPGSYE